MDYAEKVDGGRQRRFVRGVIGRFVGFCAMEYKRLGASGLQVSPICLGAMEFGDGADARTVGRIVCMAREAGVNFIDTADVNSQGHSERIIGRTISGNRDWWVVGTKVGNPMGGGPNRRGLSRRAANQTRTLLKCT